MTADAVEALATALRQSFPVKFVHTDTAMAAGRILANLPPGWSLRSPEDAAQAQIAHHGDTRVHCSDCRALAAEPLDPE